MKMEKSLSRESSLDTLKNVRLRLDTHASDTRLRLREVLDSLIEDCADDSLCLPVEHEGERGLRLCGRLYAGNVSLAEFGQRLNAELRRFGTGKAKPKAFAHVLRGIMQLEELQHEGRIRYPLAGREELSAIRQESTDRAALFRLLSRLRTRLTALDNRVGEQVDRGYDPAFAKDCALACYAAPPPLPSRQSRLDEISPAIVQLVAEKVDMLERTQNIRVLYACESGSRGWGFASADSDFDVRFIYVHAPDWYLGLAPEERRDVLETGTEHRAEGVLDLSGWELRKALKLFRISNPPLLEWLSSPQVYCERGSLAERLRKAAPHSVSLLRIWHHYRSMAKKNMAHYQKHGPTIKGWFYVLRPLLAARWVEERRAIPPMRFDLLLEGSRCDPEFRAEVTELVARKKEGNEKEAFTPPPRIAAFAEAETARQDRPDLPAAASEPENLNALFRDILHEAWGMPYGSRNFLRHTGRREKQLLPGTLFPDACTHLPRSAAYQTPGTALSEYLSGIRAAFRGGQHQSHAGRAGRVYRCGKGKGLFRHRIPFQQSAGGCPAAQRGTGGRGARTGRGPAGNSGKV